MSFWRKRCPRPDDTRHITPWATPDALRTLGRPVPLGYLEHRPDGPRMVGQPVPVFVHSRPYSRGSDAYAPQFGYLPYNPIGAGVVSVARLPTIAGPSARYVFGSIFWAPQTMPTSVSASPSMSQQSVNALIGQTQVTAAYGTTG